MVERGGVEAAGRVHVSGPAHRDLAPLLARWQNNLPPSYLSALAVTPPLADSQIRNNADLGNGEVLAARSVPPRIFF